MAEQNENLPEGTDKVIVGASNETGDSGTSTELVETQPGGERNQPARWLNLSKPNLVGNLRDRNRWGIGRALPTGLGEVRLA